MNLLQRHLLALSVCLALTSWSNSAAIALAMLAGAEGYEQRIIYKENELAKKEKVLGADRRCGLPKQGKLKPKIQRQCLDLAEALSELAGDYKDQGRYADAEPLYTRAVAIREKTLGTDHPDVATALNDLAELHREQGHYSTAERLYKRALQIREKALGADHPDVGILQRQMGKLYQAKHQYADAESFFLRSLQLWDALGPHYAAGVASLLRDLGALYSDQGRYADAEPLYKRALAIYENVFPASSPFSDADRDEPVAWALNDLAELYERRGRYTEAEPLYKRALKIERKWAIMDDSKVASVLGRLGRVYHAEGRDADAEPTYREALKLWEEARGPDYLELATSFIDLGALYLDQRRYIEAEPLFKRAIAIREKALGSDHPEVATALNNLAALYGDQQRYREALPLVQRVIAQSNAASWAALPILYGAESENLLPAGKAFDDSLSVTQRASRTAAGEALNALSARFASGSGPLAELVRRDQDLTAKSAALDMTIIASVSNEQAKRDATAEQSIKDQITAIAQERNDLRKVLARKFPDYAALSNSEPLTLKDIQPLLADDEALVVINLGDKKSYIWAITRSVADWKELAITAAEVSKQVSSLRSLLNLHTIRPFDAQASFELYREILEPVEDALRGMSRLSFVLNGALTSLPPQLLVTRDPTGKALKDLDWLIRTRAVTVLPSVPSLRVLRDRGGKPATAGADRPLIGFADPVFDRDPPQLQNARVAANLTAVGGTEGTLVDVAGLHKILKPLPETATELREVADSVHADPADVILGPDATVTRVKQEKLDQYRIVFFATHGLLAGDVADFAKLNAEPALVLSLPEYPTEYDDGLLTASEAAQLKLNADWVVLSACNTASSEKPGAEALSGLARAFFYAGARSLIVSNWEVNSDSTVALMVGTFAALGANAKLSHAEALQRSMLAMIDNTRHPQWADPKYWAPFVVVGEPAKPAN
jgi:CHAT domain-containing protein/Tfp pilus assembly protein PilF